MKYSVDPQMFGPNLYSRVPIVSKTYLMTKLSEKLEAVRDIELENL